MRANEFGSVKGWLTACKSHTCADKDVHAVDKDFIDDIDNAYVGHECKCGEVFLLKATNIFPIEGYDKEREETLGRALGTPEGRVALAISCN